MKIRRFESHEEFLGEAAAELRARMECRSAAPHAVVVPGGRTPFALYRQLAEAPPQIDARFHMILSDERYVSEAAPNSNFGRMRPLLDSMGVNDRQVLRPNCCHSIEQSALQFNHDIGEFFERGGQIGLGFLGVGNDGHTASIFSLHHLKYPSNPYATEVLMSDPPDRISITAEVISRIERVIFICAGSEKNDIVAQIESDPTNVIAFLAAQGVHDIELWHSTE